MLFSGGINLVYNRAYTGTIFGSQGHLKVNALQQLYKKRTTLTSIKEMKSSFISLSAAAILVEAAMTHWVDEEELD
jgi:hypothetical protein